MEETETNNRISFEQRTTKIQSLEGRLVKIESVISLDCSPDLYLQNRHLMRKQKNPKRE